MANLTKLDLTLIYSKPMLAVTENSVELTGLFSIAFTFVAASHGLALGARLSKI